MLGNPDDQIAIFIHSIVIHLKYTFMVKGCKGSVEDIIKERMIFLRRSGIDPGM